MSEISYHFCRPMPKLSLVLSGLAMSLSIAAAAVAEPTTRPSDKDKVDVGVFVQATTWDPKRVTSFPIILHCSCRLGSRSEGRKLNVIDGTEGQGESDCLLRPPENPLHDAYELNVPNPGHPGDYWVWCYEFKDAAGHRLDRLGEPKDGIGTDEPLYPYPERSTQRTLGSDGAFFLTSIDSSDISTVEASKLILRALVVLDYKVVGRSNEVTIDLAETANPNASQFKRAGH
jgi:hypothetical protein